MKKKVIAVLLLLIIACVGGFFTIKISARNKTIEEVKSLIVAEIVKESCGDDISVDDISIELEVVSYNSKRNDYGVKYKAWLTGTCNEEFSSDDLEDYDMGVSEEIRSKIKEPSGLHDVAYIDMDTKIVGLMVSADYLLKFYKSFEELGGYANIDEYVEYAERAYINYVETHFDYDGLMEFNDGNESWEDLPEKYFK